MVKYHAALATVNNWFVELNKSYQFLVRHNLVNEIVNAKAILEKKLKLGTS